MNGDTTQVKEARETITANLDAQCIREFGEVCSRVRFVGDTICLQWFEVGGKRFRLDEGDRVRLHKGNCPKCGIALWSREFILSSTTAQHAANDNPVSHACVIRDTSRDFVPVSHACVIRDTSRDLVKVGDEYLELLFFNYDRVNPIMRYKEVLIVGGINDRSLRLCTGIVDQGGLPRFLIRKEEEERIPGNIRAGCRVTLGDALIRESVEMAAQGTSGIMFVPGPNTQVNVQIVRHLELAASLWRIRLKILP